MNTFLKWRASLTENQRYWFDSSLLNIWLTLCFLAATVRYSDWWAIACGLFILRTAASSWTFGLTLYQK